MASFTAAETERQWDYELLSDGAVTGFRSEEMLDHVIAELTKLGYGIAEVTGGTGATMLLELLEPIPAHYDYAVGNLGATMGALRHLDLSGRTGWALVIRRFDETFAADPEWARGLCDVVTRASYEHLLMGDRFLMLVQSPVELPIGVLGGEKPTWFTGRP
ncbi:hypothetical protein QLQ12_34260 [Actinoplanes sp. NEAU-A12]|uniref:Barstar (barnase inhibitor) domain-containing protein n=1 Tax=Actinoplanes sandaracinus TaxID=3045177 RepID=A0ABT6WVB8_9ACTN|nr:hypothetical protein [Actinoplanes sandaracinus]MDI6103690.1 hypothetical protein [Actinoplanes sandaracinus]